LKPIQLAQKLALLPAKRWKQLSFLVGFDGFADTLYSVVKRRSSPTRYTCIHSIGEFARALARTSGQGTNFELVTKQKKIGGNGPILAEALCEMGAPPLLIGTLGLPKIEPLFTPLTKRCKKVISYAPSAVTDALEFEDGKIMLGKHENILQSNLKKALGGIREKALLAAFNEADIVAATNWTMLFGMTEFWKYLFEHIAPRIAARKRTFFVDFADPAKRSRKDLQEALEILRLGRKYYQIILGMNLHEAEQISALCNTGKRHKNDLLSFTAQLASSAGVDGVVLHTTKEAYAMVNGKTHLVRGPYTATPKITTGGGDNFNAGFLLGLGLNLSLDEALMLATATSGYYVRHAKSPNRKELIRFLKLSF